MPLPTDPKERKATPIYSGVLKYFPLALAEVARVSKAGNDQHNPGQPLHWDKSKSRDHRDCELRHMMEAGDIDTDGMRHSAKAAWRALAALEEELEAELIVPVPVPEEIVQPKAEHHTEKLFSPHTTHGDGYYCAEPGCSCKVIRPLHYCSCHPAWYTK